MNKAELRQNEKAYNGHQSNIAQELQKMHQCFDTLSIQASRMNRFYLALKAIDQIFTDWENDTVKYSFREINEKIEEIVSEALYS